MEREFEEALRLLREADDLYTNYGLLAQPDYGDPGKWIGQVRDFLRQYDRPGEPKGQLPTDEFGATAADRQMLARHGIAWGD